MPSGGANRRPTAELRAIGGYRPDRHGDRLDNVEAVGSPTMPEGLTDSQRRDWIQITADLPKGVLGRLDTALLTEYVMVSQYLRDTRAQLAEDPTDKDTRIAYAAYFDRWLRLVNELGLSPSSRARLQVPREPEQDNPLERLRAKKAAAL